MGDLISQKSRYAVTTVLFIVSFLLSLFIFSKHSLQPSVAVYQQLSPLIKSQIQSSDPPSPPPPPPIESSTHQLSPSNVPQADELVSSSNAPIVHDDKHLSAHQLSPSNVPQADELVSSSNAPIVHDDKHLSAHQLSPSNIFPADELVSSSNAPSPEDKQYPPLDAVDNGEEEKQICDIYTGNWVKNPDYPLYKPGSCPYVDEAFDCQSNGRKDSEYLRWRWKPDGCDLPRFNATDFLERLRGKKLLLVGDSMNRNQFESMLCLLREGLANKSKMYEINGNKITKGRGRFVFKFEDYNCTVEFVRSHFLVREGVRINGQGNSNPTLSIDRIDKSSGRWKRADILIFNTGHWWVHGKTARGLNYFREGDYVYPKFDSVEAYRRAMKTWAKWIDKNVNHSKQLVLYRGYSSAHFRGGDWNSGGSCNGETEPILSGSFIETYPLKMKIVEEVIQEMKVPVILLNVTRLTNFRKDGHPSVYGKILTDGQKRSTRRQDCSHWCLPGVPDAWNELIYAILVFNKQI